MLQENNPDAACMYYLVRYIYIYEEAKKFRKVPRQTIVSSSAINYRLRSRAERWENIPRVSSEVGEVLSKEAYNIYNIPFATGRAHLTA